jgi:hypothetical protein
MLAFLCSPKDGVMKLALVASTIFLATLSSSSVAATYMDNDLDDGSFSCNAGEQDSGHYPLVTCRFLDNTVILELADGSVVHAKLASDELPEDGSAVFAVDTGGKTWMVTFRAPEIWRGND